MNSQNKKFYSSKRELRKLRNRKVENPFLMERSIAAQSHHHIQTVPFGPDPGTKPVALLPISLSWNSLLTGNYQGIWSGIDGLAKIVDQKVKTPFDGTIQFGASSPYVQPESFETCYGNCVATANPYRAERPAAVMVAPLEQIVSDECRSPARKALTRA
jgi:hypothetical protein